MAQPFDERPEEKKQSIPHAAFDAMSEQIRHNKASPFGGALVIVPPGEDEEPLSLLVLSANDPAVFWMMLSAKIKMRLEQIDEKERSTQAFGARR